MTRATTLEELDAIIGKLFTQESWQRGMAFRPRPRDLIISPFPKSGTTWLQQIAHGLRTRGSMDFEEITEVTPWIEIAYGMGWDLDAPQVSEPRVYKSHLSWHDVPKAGRYIVSFRHPYDVEVSRYRFFEGWLFEPGSISLEDFVRSGLSEGELDKSGYWHHLLSWWEQRYNPDVLLLCYEDMKENLASTVQKVALFMGIELDDDLLDIVVRQSTRDFMLANDSHFDEKYIRMRAEKLAGVPRRGISAKVTSGAPDEPRYQLSSALKNELDEIWREQVQPKFGFKDYGELRHALGQLHTSG